MHQRNLAFRRWPGGIIQSLMQFFTVIDDDEKPDNCHFVFVFYQRLAFVLFILKSGSKAGVMPLWPYGGRRRPPANRH